MPIHLVSNCDSGTASRSCVSIENWTGSGLVAPWEPSHPDRNRKLLLHWERWRNPHSFGTPANITTRFTLLIRKARDRHIRNCRKASSCPRGQKVRYWKGEGNPSWYPIPPRSVVWDGTSAIIPFVTAPYSAFHHQELIQLQRSHFLKEWVDSGKTTMAFDAYYRDAYYRIHMENSLSTGKRGMAYCWTKYGIQIDGEFTINRQGAWHIVVRRVAYYSLLYEECALLG